MGRIEAEDLRHRSLRLHVDVPTVTQLLEGKEEYATVCSVCARRSGQSYPCRYVYIYIYIAYPFTDLH